MTDIHRGPGLRHRCRQHPTAVGPWHGRGHHADGTGRSCPRAASRPSGGGMFVQIGRVFIENKLAVVGLIIIVASCCSASSGRTSTTPTRPTSRPCSAPSRTRRPGTATPWAPTARASTSWAGSCTADRPRSSWGSPPPSSPPWSASLYGATSGFFGGSVDACHDAVRRHAPLHPRPVPAHRPGHHLQLSEVLIILVIAFVSWLIPARLIRGETLTLRVREYVQAVRVMGGAREPDRRPAHHPQLRRHHRGVRHLPGGRLDPAAGRPRVTSASAIPAPQTDWGTMLSNGADAAGNGWWWEIYPAGIAIILVVVALQFRGRRPPGLAGGPAAAALSADRGALGQRVAGGSGGRVVRRAPASAAGSGRRRRGRPRTRLSGGSTSAQSASAPGHRVRNRHPDGGSTAEGSSPRTAVSRRCGP